MVNLKLKYYLTVIGLFCVSFVAGQAISGYVMDQDNNPLPFVNVYVKHTSTGTTTDNNGFYFLNLDQGDYDLIFSSIGYKTKEIQVLLQKEVAKNIYLLTSSVEMDEIVVKAKGRDPAYEIIQKAINAKRKNNKILTSSRCNVYIKASEVISFKEQKKRENKKKKKEIVDVTKNPEDQQNKEIEKLANSLNITEVQLQRNYQYPDAVKEIRTAYEQRGSKAGLFYLSTNEGSFNFYDNLISAENLTQIPIVSPLNTTAILTYKFKLESTFVENGALVYHIKVTPRKQGGNTVEGYLDIVNGSYAIRSLEFSFPKLGLMYYDDFSIIQRLKTLGDSCWVIDRQEFYYQTKMGKKQFAGRTTALFDNYELNIEFPKRFFKNELAVTTKEAYDRDTSYWNANRPEPLTREEQKIIAIKDSIKAAHNTKAYLDSIDREYNKITLSDALWYGMGFFNREKKRHIYVSGLAEFINPFQLGGLAFGPGFLYFKKTPDEKSYFCYLNTNYGIRNQDFKFDVQSWHVYNPFRQSNVYLNVGHNFDMVQDNQSFTGVMDRANYVEQTYLDVGHSVELFNGFYLDLTGEFIETSPITNYEFGEWSSDLIENNVPRSFEVYQIFRLYTEIQYTPFQKYITEPKQKIVLGSKWPSFSLLYEKGVPGVFGSDINFDYLRVNVLQDFKLKTFGTSTYKVQFGKFLTKESLTYEVKKNYPRGDRWFFSSPMQNQLQDVTLLSEEWSFDAHYVHHFNGAIVNYIPLIKKLRIHTLAGLNYLYVADNDYHYADFYFGLERVIRLQRQRFRLGVYFVYGGSSYQLSKPTIQFAINHYNKREKSWGY